jgi:uncharacterized protein YqeY
MIIDAIKTAKIEALKNRQEAAKGILSLLADRYLLLSIEAKAQQKQIGDVDMVAIIMKVMKELEDEKALYVSQGATDRASNIDQQLAAVRVFLPAMMSEQDIRQEIAKLADKSLPSIMKHFKANFAGKVDMGLVSQIAKSR